MLRPIHIFLFVSYGTLCLLWVAFWFSRIDNDCFDGEKFSAYSFIAGYQKIFSLVFGFWLTSRGRNIRYKCFIGFVFFSFLPVLVEVVTYIIPFKPYP